MKGSFTLTIYHNAPVLAVIQVLLSLLMSNFWFSGYKNWCINHAVDCVENITTGDFPYMILKAHQEYLKGYNAANDSGNSMCPIGQNTAFCRGWDDNNDDYGKSDCEDAYFNMAYVPPTFTKVV